VEDYEAQVMRAFQWLSLEAGAAGGGRILSLSVSPWIMGYPHRIATLQRLLARILNSGSGWHANGMQIADTFTMQAK
jgi:hypothetical protein